MSQDIGPVTVCHSMSLVVTFTKDCATPFIKIRQSPILGLEFEAESEQLLMTHWTLKRYG